MRAVISIGATEQHGPLPIETDTIIAEAVSIKMAKEIGATFLPTIPYGYTEMFMDYPGTYSFEPDTIASIFRDLFRSLSIQGFSEVLVISSHDPNLAIIKPECFKANEKYGMKIILMDIWNIEKIKSVIESEIYHACEDEASVLLYLGGEMKRAVKELPYEMRMNYSIFPMPKEYRSRSGVYGDLTKASRDKGEEIFNIIINEIKTIVNKEW